MTTLFYIKEKTLKGLEADYRFYSRTDANLYQRGYATALKTAIELLKKNIITVSDRNDFRSEEE